MSATHHSGPPSRIPHPQEDVLDLTALDDRPSDRTTSDSQDAHLWRLCLDLQLDSLLLAIGAAAVTGQRGGTSPGSTAALSGDEELPWRRWVAEDVDLACVLACDSLSGGATVPSTLGSDLHRAVPATAIDSLVARFSSMRSLLTDLAELRPAWGSQVEEARERCEHRLEELQRFRLSATPPRGITLAGRQSEYLPGELLG